MDYDGATLTWSLVGRVTPSDLGLDGEGEGWLQLPTPVELDNGDIRVFFATRRGQRPHIRSVDLRIQDGAIENLHEIQASAPLIEPGGRNWDVDGIYPSSIVRVEDGFFLYTIGWERGPIDPFFIARIGLVHLGLDLELVEYFVEPTLDLTKREPFLVSGPCVRRRDDEFEMIYTCGESWLISSHGPDSRYSLRLARSSDGRVWKYRGIPSVMRTGEVTHIGRSAFLGDVADGMIASVTTSHDPSYRLRICSKVHADRWEIGESGILSDAPPNTVSAYPAVIHRDEETLLFANGSDRGQSGFSILQQIG